MAAVANNPAFAKKAGVPRSVGEEFMKADKMNFGDAFKEARSAGKKQFEFNGKMYHTRTKDEESKLQNTGKNKVQSSAANKVERATASSIRTKDTPPPPRTETRVTAKKPTPPRKPLSSKPSSMLSPDIVGERYSRLSREGKIPGMKSKTTTSKPAPKSKAAPKSKRAGGGRSAAARRGRK
ncbi:MAG: hypothetical protein RLZZ602_1607 [Pseudomonadota bacterium]